MDSQDSSGIFQDDVLDGSKRVKMCGTVVDALSYDETVALVEKYIVRKAPLHLVGLNADKVNQMRKNPKLAQIISGCGIVNADGASIVMASRFLGHPVPERVTGIDLMYSLLALSEKKGYRVFLLGARQEVIQKTKENLQSQYPKLQIAGARNGYFSETEWPEVASKIKAAEPDIVFVGITSPKKEYFIEFLQKSCIPCVLMGVGGSFDVVSGRIPRAPQWMQQANLEWLFRLWKEPRRLFGRYFFGNISFICFVLKEKLRSFH